MSIDLDLAELDGWPGDAADLRAGIEALRDEWRAVHDEYRDAAGLGVRGAVATVYAMNADALDALLREGE